MVGPQNVDRKGLTVLFRKQKEKKGKKSVKWVPTIRRESIENPLTCSLLWLESASLSPCDFYSNDSRNTTNMHAWFKRESSFLFFQKRKGAGKKQETEKKKKKKRRRRRRWWVRKRLVVNFKSLQLGQCRREHSVFFFCVCVFLGFYFSSPRLATQVLGGGGRGWC